MHASHPTNDNTEDQGLNADAPTQEAAQARAEELVDDLALEPPDNLVSDAELHQLRAEASAVVSDSELRRLQGEHDDAAVQT